MMPGDKRDTRQDMPLTDEPPMISDSSPSEQTWCCPRCRCQRYFAVVEKGPSSTIEYESTICTACAYVEWRAVDLDVVTALATGGLGGVCLVEAPPPLAASSASAIPAPPLSTPERAAALRLREPAAEAARPSSGRMLTLLLVIASLSVAAWLLFGRTQPTEDVDAVAAGIPSAVQSNSPRALGSTDRSDLAPFIPASELAGAPHGVDPAALLEQARRVSDIGGTAVLTQIEAVFMGSNGRVDLDNPFYKGRIVYRFEGVTGASESNVRPQGMPLGAPWPGAPPAPRRLLRTVTVNVDGMRVTEREESPVPSKFALAQEVLPRCSFRQIWDAARTGDAPVDAVAGVKYTVKGDRPTWWFQVEHTSFGFSFDPNTCMRY